LFIETFPVSSTVCPTEEKSLPIDEVKWVCNSLLTLKCFNSITAVREDIPTLNHLVWMIQEIKTNQETWSEGKVGRWLGFIQGVLCFQGITTIEKERKRNTMVFDLKECPHINKHTENYDPI
jgi:hypothetical protein